MYFVTATHYLTGIAPGLLLLVPALEIYFDLRPVVLGTTFASWLLFYAGFYFMQILLAFYTLGSFRWEVLMLATASFPIYHQALINAFSGKEQKWHVTGAQGTRTSPFNFIRPQVYLFVFLALTSVVAIWRDLNNAQLSLATGWNLTNTVALGVLLLVALREGRTASASPEPPEAEPAVIEPPLDQVVRERARDLVPAVAGSLASRSAAQLIGDPS